MGLRIIGKSSPAKWQFPIEVERFLQALRGVLFLLPGVKQ